MAFYKQNDGSREPFIYPTGFTLYYYKKTHNYRPLHNDYPLYCSSVVVYGIWFYDELFVLQHHRRKYFNFCVVSKVGGFCFVLFFKS